MKALQIDYPGLAEEEQQLLVTIDVGVELTTKPKVAINRSENEELTDRTLDLLEFKEPSGPFDVEAGVELAVGSGLGDKIPQAIPGTEDLHVPIQDDVKRKCRSDDVG